MPRRETPVHYLRPNERVWSPPAVICFDTETRAELAGDTEIHTLRCWAGEFTARSKAGPAHYLTQCAAGTTATELADQVEAWMKGRETVWMYAHNLHFDLSVTDLCRILTDRGWVATSFTMDAGSPFVRMSRGSKTLTIVDSFSWLPVPLAQVAAVTGIDKPPLPADDDSDASWLARCQADTAILSAAMVALMDWWDRAELGNWSVTGTASGWNAMRHIPMTRRIVVDPDPVGVACDRAAVYGGRRGTWRHGTQPPGRYTELDLEKAYTVACRDRPLPCKRLTSFDSLPIDHPWVTSERYGVIAECVIRTDTPRWPARCDGKVWYPVGEFATTLAGPDLADAKRRGALVSIGKGFVHQLGYALRNWATWVIDLASQPDATVPAVAKIAAKQWGRSVVGKWAQRGFDTLKLGPSPGRDWTYTEAWNHSRGCRAAIMDFGGWRWQMTASGDADNAYPAILAWVESYVRVAICRVADAVGPAAMVACDTDGLIVDCTAVRATVGARLAQLGMASLRSDYFSLMLATAKSAALPFTLREKHVYKRVDVLGPQHLTLDDGRRLSGIPRAAQPYRDGLLWARLWPKLAWQIGHGRAGTYARPAQTFRLAASYAAGWITDRGAVLPPEVYRDGEGNNHIRQWPLCRHARAGARLGPDQPERLRRYADAA